MFSAVAFAQLPTPTYGWNMGNTLEPPCGEGCWGPAATQNLINTVADSGFNVIRIPCAWDSNANSSTYVIDSAYMARVKQIVDWCYAKNLHVIINCHWDGGWLENNIGTSVNSTINAKQSSYWTQIANTFKNYDDRLLFAGCNEPNVDNAAQMATLLVYEQTFIDAVRAAGGNNSTRWLIVQGPGTDVNKTYNLMNTLPTDSTPGRMMVEIHYYDPYQYTLLKEDADWGKMFYFWGQDYHHDTMTDRNPTWGEEAWVNTQFEKMKTKFVDHGVPVIVGEFCTFTRTGYAGLTGDAFDLHLAGRTFFHKTIVDTANSKGLKPIYWDIQGLMFNWTSGAVVDPDNVSALTGGSAVPPPGSDKIPPDAPANLSAELESVYVSLDWDDNGEPDLAGYNVYRSVVPGILYEKINTGVVSDSEYTDTGAEGGQEYFYYVTAVDTSSNESSWSNEESATVPVNALGTILREIWTGIPGTSVDDLTGNSNFPDSPSDTDTPGRLEGSTNWSDQYGSRFRGYLYPPATGDYTFWIAGDDNCQLWLSTDGMPDNAVMIANVPGWTNSRDWSKFTEQRSAAISMVSGGKYYIEVLHKEGSGGDNVAVAWAGPSITQEVIDGAYLSPPPGGTYGDLNGSGAVTGMDLEMFAEDWLWDDCRLTSMVDLNGDCIVNLYELAELAANWLQ